MLKVTKARAAAAVLAAAAIAAPSAAASPIDPVATATSPSSALPAGVNSGYGPGDTSDSTPAVGGLDAAVARPAGAPSNDFDWGDAGIGAAGALSLLGVGAGILVISRRGRRSQPAIS